MAIQVVPVACGGQAASSLMVSWCDSQFVMVIAEKGVVACGVVDRDVMDRAGAAIAITRGTRENPLVTTDDLLNATIQDVTSKAAEYGVEVGMTGRQALEVLCG